MRFKADVGLAERRLIGPRNVSHHRARGRNLAAPAIGWSNQMLV